MLSREVGIQALRLAVSLMSRYGICQVFRSESSGGVFNDGARLESRMYFLE